jgi:hypothetical protein
VCGSKWGVRGVGVVVCGVSRWGDARSVVQDVVCVRWSRKEEVNGGAFAVGGRAL